MDKETGIFNGGKLKHSLIHAQKIEGERNKDTTEMGPFAWSHNIVDISSSSISDHFCQHCSSIQYHRSTVVFFFQETFVSKYLELIFFLILLY
jgi:hypothetical protein